MNTCIDCGKLVIWNSRSELCRSCFDKQLGKSEPEDRVVESPHLSWF